jgi:hypothetical protein
MTCRYSDAYNHYEKSHQIFKDHLPVGSSFIARSSIGMGESSLNVQSADYQWAVQQISSGYDRVKEIHPRNSIEFGLASAAMGKMYLKSDRMEEGVSYLNQAHQIVSKIEGESSFRATAIESLITQGFPQQIADTEN